MNASSGRLQEVRKQWKIIQLSCSKSGHGRLQEVVVYQRFHLLGFDWENFGVWEVDAYERWSHMGV